MVEARARLVTGLKRYFHGKRAEGLLGANGVQLLDYACDLQMDHSEKALFMWGLVERRGIFRALQSDGQSFSHRMRSRELCALLSPRNAPAAWRSRALLA